MINLGKALEKITTDASDVTTKSRDAARKRREELAERLRLVETARRIAEEKARLLEEESRAVAEAEEAEREEIIARSLEALEAVHAKKKAQYMGRVNTQLAKYQAQLEEERNKLIAAIRNGVLPEREGTPALGSDDSNHPEEEAPVTIAEKESQLPLENATVSCPVSKEAAGDKSDSEKPVPASDSQLVPSSSSVLPVPVQLPTPSLSLEGASVSRRPFSAFSKPIFDFFDQVDAEEVMVIVGPPSPIRGVDLEDGKEMTRPPNKRLVREDDEEEKDAYEAPARQIQEMKALLDKCKKSHNPTFALFYNRWWMRNYGSCIDKAMREMEIPRYVSAFDNLVTQCMSYDILPCVTVKKTGVFLTCYLCGRPRQCNHSILAHGAGFPDRLVHYSICSDPCEKIATCAIAFFASVKSSVRIQDNAEPELIAEHFVKLERAKNELVRACTRSKRARIASSDDDDDDEDYVAPAVAELSEM